MKSTSYLSHLHTRMAELERSSTLASTYLNQLSQRTVRLEHEVATTMEELQREAVEARQQLWSLQAELHAMQHDYHRFQLLVAVGVSLCLGVVVALCCAGSAAALFLLYRMQRQQRSVALTTNRKPSAPLKLT